MRLSGLCITILMITANSRLRLKRHISLGTAHDNEDKDRTLLEDQITHRFSATINGVFALVHTPGWNWWDPLKKNNLRAAALIPRGASINLHQTREVVSGFLAGFLVGKAHVDGDCVADLAIFERHMKHAMESFEGHHADDAWKKAGAALHELHRARHDCSSRNGDVIEDVADEMETTSAKELLGNVMRYIVINGETEDLVNAFSSKTTDEENAHFVFGQKLGSILGDALSKQMVHRRSTEKLERENAREQDRTQGKNTLLETHMERESTREKDHTREKNTLLETHMDRENTREKGHTQEKDALEKKIMPLEPQMERENGQNE